MEPQTEANGNPEKTQRLCQDETVIDIALKEIGLKYERFRLSRPELVSAVEGSFRKYGQFTPIVVGRLSAKGYEMIDGFKRYHCARKLQFTHLQGRVLGLSVHALKAAMVQLNSAHGSIGPFEEGLILNSLHREDGLRQNEIAVLFGRHKSWVCRRIAMVERLCEEAVEHLRLGLIGIGIGRELAQLPRGNQGEALTAVLKHRLDCRETAQLVQLLLSHPKWNHESILRFPEPILEAREPPRPRLSQSLETSGERLARAMEAICKECKRIEAVLNNLGHSRIPEFQQTHILSNLDTAQTQFDRIRLMLKAPSHATAIP